MKTISAAVISLAFLAAWIAPSRAADPAIFGPLTIEDGGRARVFEMATDEIHVRKAAPGRAERRIAPVQTPAALRTEVTRLRAAGEDAAPVLYEAGEPRDALHRRVLTDGIRVELDPGADPAAVAAAAGAAGHGPAPVPGHFVFRAASPFDAPDLAARLRAVPGVRAAEALLARQQSKRFVPNDTLFAQQWHLRNTGAGGGTAGIDINVTNVWDTYRGTNMTIAIVDDGLQLTHPDLASNVNTVIDHDWNDATPDDPSPDVTADYHGSSCAGVAAGRGNNALGISGAAPEARIVGLRLIAASTTDADEAEAMTWSNATIHVKSNSWGPNDDGITLEGPGPLTIAALSNACTSGRGGRGTLFFWAGGNGLDANDNANYDGYANSPYTIAIAALTDGGAQSWYSEPGACLVVTAPSSGGATDIYTTDLVGEDGYNYTGATGETSDKNYTATFGGTSSAAPLAAGVGALILQANPNLGWRDMQEILMRTARVVSPSDTDWKTNAAGFHFNHKFGAGLINTRAAVTNALAWTNLGPRLSFATTQTNLALSIPDNSTGGVTRTFNVSTNLRLEHVTVTVNITHASRGHLAISLTSPSGITSRLAEPHADTGDHYTNWTFMTVRDWGESMQGAWTFKVADLTNGTVGTLQSVGLTFYGTAMAALSNQPPALAPIGPKTILATNLLSFAVTAADLTDGDPVRLWATNLPAWASFPAVTNAGAVTNTFTGAPMAAGTHLVTFFTADKDGTNSETVAITVTDGSAPVVLLSENFDASTSVPTGWTHSGTANDTASTHYSSSPNCRSLGISAWIATPAVAHPTQLVFYADASSSGNGKTGTVEYAINGGAWTALAAFQVSTAGSTQTVALAGTPNLSGQTNVQFRFSSSFSTWYLDSVVVLGTASGGGPVRSPPTLNPIGAQSATVSNLMQFAVSALPTDGDTVTLWAEGLPSGASFVSTGETGVFTWANAQPVGVYTSVFRAADADGTNSETVALTVLPGSSASAALAFYDFDGAGGAFDAAPDSTNAQVMAGSVATGDGAMSSASGVSGLAASDTGWTTALSNCFTFTVGPVAGKSVSIAALLFADRRSSTGPTTWRIRSSADGYASDLASGSTHSSFATNMASFLLGGLSNAVTFRVYGANASASSGTWRMDNLTVLGSVDGSGGGAADTDGDGLPDEWEAAYTNSATAMSASADPDGDGADNGQEYTMDTVPTNALSVLKIGTLRAEGGWAIEFVSSSNRNYALQVSTNPAVPESWTDVAAAVRGSNSVTTLRDAATTPRFHRLKVTLP